MSVSLLDTDVWTLGWENHPQVRSRMAAHGPPDRLVVSAITVEEVVGGWLAAIRQARTPDRLDFCSTKLVAAVRSLGTFELVPFARPAIAEFTRLAGLKLNVRHNDLRIAATALSHAATVVTRNLRDFGRVPGLACEDWSV